MPAKGETVTSSPAQLRYLADAVSTASPGALLVMLYDRLVLDLRRAADAQEAVDRTIATEQIRHAQQIIAELRSSLRMDGWEGADNLASLYGFILAELIAVNLEPDHHRLRAVEQIVTGLRDSWHQATATVLDAARAPSGSNPNPAVRQVAWVG
jgi:flagellar protein FliS